jgi:hypothetical protein
MSVSLCVVISSGCGGSASTTGENGGNNSGGENGNGNDNGSANGDDGGANGGNGNSTGNNGNGNGNGNSSDGDGGAGCTPATCESEGKNCGPIADGCGGIAECGECDSLFFCGLNEPNVCGDVTTICTVGPPSCGDYECGLIGDGCNGTVSCGTCPDGEICGLNAPFKCDAPPAPDPETCGSKIVSCASVGKECGQIGNGCGGVLNCDVELGGCGTGESCGLESPNVCGTIPVCTPIAQVTACSGKCGQAANGCGGTWDCNCPGSQTCGGGGVTNACGTPGTQSCTPLDPSTVCANKCGKVGDGCGNLINCETPGNGGTACTGSQTCGGGGVPSVCGSPPACSPVDQATACAGKCGQVSNGCNGVYTCSGCTSPAICGLTTANVCGTPTCVPVNTQTACSGKCGKIGNGCGAIIDCEASGNGGVTCGAGTWCGGGGGANVCGAPACTAKTCSGLGYECGFAPNGCGDILNCGGADACEDDEDCQGTPATCVTGPGGGVSTPTCPLCGSIPTTCTTTALTGRVTTPDGEVGVPNAYVYILKSNSVTLPSIGSGVASGACERCGDEDLGPVLASALTSHTGEFRIEQNIPVGVDFTLVVKAGKWRRAATVPAAVTTGKACTTIDITANASLYSRLPAHSADGTGAHLPKIAISTGEVDEMECVFYKAGIAASEFTVPSGSGRMHMYRSNGTRMGTGCACSMTTGTCTRATNNNRCSPNVTEGTCLADDDDCTWNPPVPTATCTANTSVADTTLFASQASVDAYDIVVFDCEGEKQDHDTADPFIREYVNKGGRLFASHWSYAWLDDNGDGPDVATNPLQTGLSQSADWSGSGSNDSDDGLISIPPGRPRGNTTKIQTFAKWFDNETTASEATFTYASGNVSAASFAITDPRDLAKSVNVGTDEWVYRTTGASTTSVQQLSFNTPFGASAANVCGRVAYSGFHVAGADNDGSDDYFPCTCEGTTLTPQEKVLLYMLFDLGQCVSTDGPTAPPTCTPTTEEVACAGKCGVVSDGCGDTIDCGDDCDEDEVCNEATNECVPQCDPQTCGDVGANCGYISDGCGGTVQCGVCTGTQVCGLNQPNVCGQPSCTPIPEVTACAGKCGPVSNGCGGVYTCPGCPSGQVCGGGGPSICGPGSCTPETMCPEQIGCGQTGDGCGGTIDCGTCTLPETCGGGGKPSQCGQPMCDPLTCTEVGANCGYIGDGCGNAVDCGKCANNGVCGGAGPNQCGGSCTPLTCGSVNANCGLIGDGCGGVVSCGDCPAGQICGATSPNQCGEGPSCPALTCADQGAECGLVGDGCGNAVDCGKCEPPLACGGDGRPNKCGKGDTGCTPLTCEGQGAECGAVGDGCGALLDCGSCPRGPCGSDGRPNQCPIGVD